MIGKILKCFAYCNPPFSILQDLWDVVIRELWNGSNILLLCLALAIESEYFRRVVSQLCVIKNLGRINFVGMNKTTGDDHVLLQFFTADHWEMLARRDHESGKIKPLTAEQKVGRVVNKGGRPQRLLAKDVIVDQLKAGYQQAFVMRMHCCRKQPIIKIRATNWQTIKPYLSPRTQKKCNGPTK